MLKLIRLSSTITRVPRFFNSMDGPSEIMEQKIQALEKNQPFFDRLIFFDPDVMASLPGPLQVFDPVVEIGKNILVNIHDFNIPWVGVLGIACLTARSFLMPLIYFQMKRTSRLATVIPAISQMKQLIDKSDYNKPQKMLYLMRLTYQIVHQQKLKWMRLFLYNVVNVPMIITLVWSIRRLLVEESFKSTSFLWIPSLAVCDPYYIVPVITRFITPDNKNSIPSRIRGIGQVLLILWLPFLCNWPSAISLYMCFNALFSCLQTTVMLNPEFQKFIDPKIFLYQIIVRMIEYDKKASDSIKQSINSGEESHQEKAISEEELVQQFKKSLQNLDEEQTQDRRKETEKEKPNFL